MKGYWRFLVSWMGLKAEEKKFLFWLYDREIGEGSTFETEYLDTPLTPAAQTAFLEFIELDDADKKQARALFEDEMSRTGRLPVSLKNSARHSWLNRASLTNAQALLGASLHLFEDGKDSIRVGQATALLESVGRSTHNTSNLIRQLRDGEPALVEILQEGLGRAGLLFKLTPEGLAKGKALREKENESVPKSKASAQ